MTTADLTPTVEPRPFTVPWPRLLQRAARRFHLPFPLWSAWRQAALFAAVTWPPLVLLALLEHRLLGPGPSLSRDVAVHVRFLFVGPLLVAFEPVAGRWLSDAAAGWQAQGLVQPQGRPILERWLTGTQRGLGSLSVLVMAAVAAYALSAENLVVYRDHVAGHWAFRAGGELSSMGWWTGLVSTPLLALALLRWLLRLVIWSALLVRLALLPLDLQASHPDGRAGLGELARTQCIFAVLALAVSSLLAAGIANAYLHKGVPVLDHRAAVAVALVLGVGLLLAPLLVYTPKLIELRRRTLGPLTRVAARQATYFEGRCLQALDPELHGPPVPQELASTHTDFSTSYSIGADMRVVLVTKRVLLVIVAGAGIPFLLVALVQLPLLEIFSRMGKLLA